MSNKLFLVFASFRCNFLYFFGISFFLFFTIGCQTASFSHTKNEDGTKGYLIQCGDSVSVDVYNEPDISRSFKVAADGDINYPMLGRLSIVGMSIADIEKLIYDLLKADYLVDPVVRVSMERTQDAPVMIFGEVRKPGSYNVKGGQRLTLLQVVSDAGGFTDIAARDRVRIVRVIDGKEKTIKVRVNDLFRGRNGITDIDLKPGDLVTVPETIF